MEKGENTLGGRIRRVREGEGLTLVGLGELLGLGKSAVSQYEHSVTNPSPETLVKIAEIGNVTIDWLITGKKPHSAVDRVAEAPSEYVRGQALGEDERRFVTMLRRIPQSQKREILDKLTSYYIDTMEVVDGGGGEEGNHRAQGNG
jgi:transcriptional regulator with XRE-family HTH domain